jgi:phosphoserine phosphatase
MGTSLQSYDEWNEKLLELYLEHADATRDGIKRILSDYTYADGARETVRDLQQKGYEIVLISGSIDILVSLVATDLGMNYPAASCGVSPRAGLCKQAHRLRLDSLTV